MTEIKLTKRYPQSRTEDIVDAYMRGWNDALDAVQNGKFHIAEQTEPNCSGIPNNCEELNAYRECVKSRSFWDSKHCDGCYFDERCPFDEPKDEPQTERSE